MKAVRFHQHGGADVLKYEEAPDPKPGPNDVIVRVRACALNRLDIWVRNGISGTKIPLPHIGGSDIAGEVAEVGSAVTHVTSGQRVLLSPGVSCGNCGECLSCNENMCRSYTMLGYMLDGGYAELVRAPAVNVMPIPGGLDFVQAASVPLVFLTAWHMLVTRAGVKPGQTVLVIAASSGVGSAAVQIAKLLRCRVIATAGGRQKLEHAARLGADQVIDHYAQDIAKAVKQITHRGVDVVVEHVGEATWQHSLRSLAPGGTVVTCGATTGNRGDLDLRFIFARQLRVIGSYMGTRGELREVMRFFDSRELRPVVDRTFPLAEVASAHRYLEDKKQFGKVVLTV